MRFTEQKLCQCGHVHELHSKGMKCTGVVYEHMVGDQQCRCKKFKEDKNNESKL